IKGEVSFAFSGKAPEDADYSKANQRGFSLQAVPVGIDGMGFFTHQGVSIPGLSVEQLQAIYTGKITNWKQLGGPDLSIAAFYPKNSSYIKVFLGSQASNLSPKVQPVRDLTASFRKVAATPGAIAFSPVGLLVGQRSVRPLAISSQNNKEYVPIITDDRRINTKALQDNTYPLSRRVFVLIRRDNTPDQIAGVAYANLLLSKEGQKFVEKAGFVPIRADK
ncbi:MAG: substrate-binding domain-containing protein, partial [Fischerella sp.]|nr:substrate-binding domain-containing protein [Fischerella sp.]